MERCSILKGILLATEEGPLFGIPDDFGSFLGDPSQAKEIEELLQRDPSCKDP